MGFARVRPGCDNPAMRFATRTTALIHSPIGAALDLLDDRRDERPLLNLSQAAPSFPPPPAIASRIAVAASEPDGARYTLQPGIPSVRAAIADDLACAYDAELAADDVVITAGCNQAFCAVVDALAGPGDNVVLVVPFYFNHDMWLRVEGIEPRYVHPAEGLIPTGAELDAAIDERTRAVTIVTPGNPGGAVVGPDRIGEIADLCAARDVALILDETYRSYRGTTAPAHRLFERHDWRETVVSLHSFSKDLAIPGYRVGAIVGGRALQAEALKVLDCVTICAPSLGQLAVETGLRECGDWRRDQADRIFGLQQSFEAVMADRPGGFELLGAGAYFGWVAHHRDRSTETVVRDLVRDHSVLTIPGTAFTPADEGMVRFSFANLEPDDVPELGHRLEELP